MAQHDLKLWPPHFDNVHNGVRTFDIRHNDRRFRAGDIIKYREFVPAEHDEHGEARYTGRSFWVRVRHVLDPLPGRDPDCGLVAGYVGLDLALIQEGDAA